MAGIFTVIIDGLQQPERGLYSFGFILSFCQYGLLGSDEWFTACPCSFPSSCEEKNPKPKSGWDFNPDKPRCSMSCEGDETNPNFLCPFFLEFGPQSPTFATNLRVVELVVGSAAVEYPHKKMRLLSKTTI